MLFGKRKKYHSDVASALFEIMPTINSRDLDLFRVLMKFKIDELYNASAPAKLAAFSLAAYFYPEVARNAFLNNVEFFKYFGPYTGWLGACAKFVLHETDFLSPSDAAELELCLLNTGKLPFPLHAEYRLSDLIDEHIRMKGLIGGS